MPLSALLEITGEEISPMPPIGIGGMETGNRFDGYNLLGAEALV